MLENFIKRIKGVSKPTKIFLVVWLIFVFIGTIVYGTRTLKKNKKIEQASFDADGCLVVDGERYTTNDVSINCVKDKPNMLSPVEAYGIGFAISFFGPIVFALILFFILIKIGSIFFPETSAKILDKILPTGN